MIDLADAYAWFDCSHATRTVRTTIPCVWYRDRNGMSWRHCARSANSRSSARSAAAPTAPSCTSAAARRPKHYALKVVPHRRPRTTTNSSNRPSTNSASPRCSTIANLIKIYALETPRDWLFRVRKVHLLIEYVNGKTLDTVPAPVGAAAGAGLRKSRRRPGPHAPPRRLPRRPQAEQHPAQPGRRREDHRLRPGLDQGRSKDRVQGTPEYMAPEQAKHSTVNERTDIYNFGATMYRLVTLRLAAEHRWPHEAACPSTPRP